MAPAWCDLHFSTKRFFRRGQVRNATFSALFRRQRAEHASTVLHWRRLDFRDIGHLGEKLVDDPTTFIDVRHFAAAKHHGDNHFVLMGKKLAGPIDSYLDVVRRFLAGCEPP